MWLSRSRLNQSVYKTLVRIKSEFLSVRPSHISGSSILLIVGILFSLLRFNSLGLIPYVFTGPAHLVLGARLALTLWLGHMLWTRQKAVSLTLAHFVPLRTPPALIRFIVLIEIVRSVIRPITLSVRLTANIIAGHLLLTLIRQTIPPKLRFLLLGVCTPLILLITLECGVALIQSYVFSMLSLLYVTEAHSPIIT